MLTPTIAGDTIAEVKRKVRSNSKFLRGRISVEDRKYAAENLVHSASQIGQLVKPPAGGVVGAYYPLGGEIDPLPLINWLRQVGWRIALPCVDVQKQPLVFRVWDADEELETGFHNIRHPRRDAEICQPDILLTPLLAFDQSGRRLGYGGGYYDRTLEKFANDGHKIVSIGLAFSVQEIEQVPFDKWDHAMDMVLTERGVFNV